MAKVRGNKNEVTLLKIRTFLFVQVVIKSDKKLILIVDRLVWKNKILSVFPQNTIFYGFLTKFLRSDENGTFLWFYKFFLFCPFDEDN